VPGVAWVRELLDEHRSIHAAIATARDLAHAAIATARDLAHAARDEARRALAHIPDSPDRDFLLALPHYVISRQR
jgi:geranylgeranyl pyrophosphate synthase